MSYQTGFIVEPVRSATRAVLREEVERFIGFFADDQYLAPLFAGMKRYLAAGDVRGIECEAIVFGYSEVMMADQPGAMALTKRIRAMAARIHEDERLDRIYGEGTAAARAAAPVRHREPKLTLPNSSHQLDLELASVDASVTCTP